MELRLNSKYKEIDTMQCSVNIARTCSLQSLDSQLKSWIENKKKNSRVRFARFARVWPDALDDVLKVRNERTIS